MKDGTKLRPRLRVEHLLVALAGVILALMVYGYFLYYPGQAGIDQPIAFSHRLHVSEKRLSCVMCHPGALNTAHAGIPPLETCMLCHSRIITEHPQIRDLRAHYEEKKPVEWKRVNTLPDYVFFVHETHLRAGFDCGKCHGDVSGMDRVQLAHDFKMGFCVQCHRDEGYSHDCFTCHR